MKDKNLPPDNTTQTLEELTKEANNIIETLEKEKDLQNSIDDYQELLQKVFQCSYRRKSVLFRREKWRICIV